MKKHGIPLLIILAMALGIAVAPVTFGAGAAQAGDARIVFYVA